MKKTIFLLVIAVLFVSQVSALTETLVVDDYVLEYEYSPSDAEAGERFSLRVTITNEGELPKSEVELEFNEDDPFDFDGDDDWTIGALAVDESKSNTFRIEIDEDALDQDYDIEFEIKDEDDSYEDEIEIAVDSNIPELIIGDVSAIPTIISPDLEDIKLTLMVENIGGGDANFVRASIELPGGFTSSSSFSDTANLGTIAESDNKEAIFYIDTEERLPAEEHEGTLVLQYEDPNDNSQVERLTFNLPVKGRPQFIITDTDTTPNTLEAGSPGEMILTIQNIGEEEGEETSVRVFEDADNPFEFNEKTQRIGSLEPGESGSAVFSFDVEGDANDRSYFVRVQVRTVNEGNVLVEEKSVRVPVTQPEGTNFLQLGLISIPILLVIVLMILVFRRRKD